MPGMSDAARKRTLADWVVKTKKQVAKLYATVKWARDADTVQKSMVSAHCSSSRAVDVILSEHNSVSYDTESTIRGRCQGFTLCQRIPQSCKVILENLPAQLSNSLHGMLDFEITIYSHPSMFSQLVLI